LAGTLLVGFVAPEFLKRIPGIWLFAKKNYLLSDLKMGQNCLWLSAHFSSQSKKNEQKSLKIMFFFGYFLPKSDLVPLSGVLFFGRT